MRVREYPDKVPEPVTDEVIRKLWATIEHAETVDHAIHGSMGLQPSGTKTVPVRYETLRELLVTYQDASAERRCEAVHKQKF